MSRRRVIAILLARSLLAFATLFLTQKLAGAAPDADLHGLGVVYLHGKASWPGALNGGILGALQDEGALVATPEMPWSFHRRYAATYDQAMAEIDAAIAELKAKGARRIVIVGHWLGPIRSGLCRATFPTLPILPTLPAWSRSRRGICRRSTGCAVLSPTRSCAPKA